ncbi:hypothetical protein NE237_025577 [Protea cynaroides]|uniref:Uncharacterized protein n=1 Tax=Protea cynaroides TaxID=273540 RepID=A0A9Q0H4H2_9MAGN|nr:hypothetical protein NE237_025577 [Protea cynaroides]
MKTLMFLTQICLGQRTLMGNLVAAEQIQLQNGGQSVKPRQPLLQDFGPRRMGGWKASLVRKKTSMDMGLTQDKTHLPRSELHQVQDHVSAPLDGRHVGVG